MNKVDLDLLIRAVELRKRVGTQGPPGVGTQGVGQMASTGDLREIQEKRKDDADFMRPYRFLSQLIANPRKPSAAELKNVGLTEAEFGQIDKACQVTQKRRKE